MTQQTQQEAELAQVLVSALNLEGVEAAGIDPAAPLFGHNAGSLGLDSIDALEIALAVQQQYGVELRSDEPDMKQIFGSLRGLSEHVLAHRVR